MANPRKNITISAPAFKGLNTQDSPIDMDPSYAAIAENMTRATESLRKQHLKTKNCYVFLHTNRFKNPYHYHSVNIQLPRSTAATSSTSFTGRFTTTKVKV